MKSEELFRKADFVVRRRRQARLDQENVIRFIKRALGLSSSESEEFFRKAFSDPKIRQFKIAHENGIIPRIRCVTEIANVLGKRPSTQSMSFTERSQLAKLICEA